jgi:O-antigen/teichoic acid export membrane protein
VAAHLGTTGFGEYALARRTLSFLSPIALLGVDLAIARFAAYVGGEASTGARSYPPVGLLAVARSAGYTQRIMLVFRSSFALLLLDPEPTFRCRNAADTTRRCCTSCDC